MKLTPQNELLVGIAIIVVVALAMVAFLIVPQFGALSDLDSQRVKAQQDVDSARGILTRRQAAKDEAAQTQVALMTLENQVPDEPGLPSLIMELQNTASDAGLNWVRIEPKEPENRGGYTAVPLVVKLDGSWSDCIDYVSRLAGLERQVRVTGVTIKPLTDPNQGSDTTSSTAGSAMPLEADIQLEAYVMGGLESSQTTTSSSPTAAPSTTTSGTGSVTTAQ